MMKSFYVVYSPAALDDLKLIYSYIAFNLEAPENAKKQVDRIRNIIASLDHIPERFSQVNWDPWLSIGIRMLPINNYIVYYLVNNTDNLVTIIRIFYKGRDIKNIGTDLFPPSK